MEVLSNIINMSANDVWKLVLQMLSATEVVLKIFALTTIFSIPLGILVAVLRMSKNKFVSIPVRIYQFITRGTPLILQLLFIYFGPKYVFMSMGYVLTYDRFTAGIIAFVINYAAYYGETFRAGIESINKGQYEAGKVLGYNKVQTFTFIILPQVIKRILPTMGNEFMVLIKDTALISVIAVTEIFKIAEKMSATYVSVMPFFIAGLFYLVLNSVVEQTFIYLEKKLDYYKG